MATEPTVLIVEDDPAIAEGLRAFLESENFLVEHCDDGGTAAERALELLPDVLLLDISLPRRNGLDICRELRQRGFIKPILLLTSRAEQLDKVLWLESAADDYITKPFDLRELLARVRAHTRSFQRTVQTAAPLIETQSYNRRLLAIMFTDIKDYAKMMNADERRAVRLVGMHNRLMQEEIKGHGGQVAEIIGDAFVATFGSAVRSVECGLAVQKKLAEYNQQQPEPEQVHVRIGIHLGDVLEHADGKLAGDSVNIAARLQQIATPGCVTVSDSVFIAIRHKIDCHAASLGERFVKNIQDPVVIYELST